MMYPNIQNIGQGYGELYGTMLQHAIIWWATSIAHVKLMGQQDR